MLAGNDPSKRPLTEETLAAGVAAVGGESQKPLNKQQRPVIDALAGNPIKVKIPALGTVRQMNKRKCHSLRIESHFTGLATPRPAAGEREQKVDWT
jgi:hypothetical protein